MYLFCPALAINIILTDVVFNNQISNTTYFDFFLHIFYKVFSSCSYS